jgi:acetoacetate decarboxylase
MKNPSNSLFDYVFETPADSPLVPKLPVTFRNTEILTIFYRSRRENIEKIVPPPLRVASDYVAVHFYHMNDAEWFGNYYESAVHVDVDFEGTSERGAYSPYLFLGNDGAVAAGREIYGQPKKGGQPELKVVDDLFIGRVTRNGIDILTGTLAYKQQRATAEQLQRRFPFSTNFNLKVVPHIDGSLAVKQLTARTFQDVIIHEIWTGPATIEIRPNAQAPAHKLPVVEMLEGFYWRADFTLTFGRVLYDYLHDH